MREGAGVTTVNGDATGREYDGSVGRSGEVHHALIEDGTSGEGIGGREGHDAVAGLDEAHRVTGAVIGDDRVDDEFADADRPGLGGLGRDGGTRDRDLRGAVDGDDERADRDTRASDGHAGADAHGGIHRDSGGIDRRGTRKRGTCGESLVITRSSGVRAERDLRVGIHRNHSRSSDEISVSDRHARTQTKGVDGDDDG